MNDAIKRIQTADGLPPNSSQGFATANSSGNAGESEERVLRAFLDPGTIAEQDVGHQISRSLDEYYYHALEYSERERRNKDQVIYRFQNAKENAKDMNDVKDAKDAEDIAKDSPESLICMVDQMWLYIIDESKFFFIFDSAVQSLPADKLIAMARYCHHLFSSAPARSWYSA
jgi:hypothetical protein